MNLDNEQETIPRQEDTDTTMMLSKNQIHLLNINTRTRRKNQTTQKSCGNALNQ